MELLKKYKESIIIQRALALFFYNFNTYPEILEEMKSENSGFANEWQKLSIAAKEKSKKSGWMSIIEFEDIYVLFSTKLSYKAQALLIDKVMNYYEKQAREDIEFSIEIDEKIEAIRNKEA